MLARATGTVYARAWRQAVFAALLLLGALVGSEQGTIGVAVGVVLALFCNYVLMAWLSLSTTGMTWREFATLHVRGLLLAALFGVSAAASAAWLRSIGASSIVVLLLATTASCCAFLAVAIASPSRVLGADGMWLWQTIAGRSRDSRSAAA
jgi:PST family polysaccharide transporter